MAYKHSLEALDRTLKDIKNNDKLFGGTLLLLSGDFRQTLPVIPRSTYADEINACLKLSRLWRNVEKVHTQYANHKWLAERAIVAAKNVDVDGLNLKIQQLLPGDLVSYKSIDAVCDTNETVNYPIEFLDSLDLPGMPPHHLQLKAGSPIILLRFD